MACIFSGSVDGTIRKWRLIDGEELKVVLWGHTKPVTFLCMTLEECYLLGASTDSVRIWDLGTNNTVGEPHRKYVASGGLNTRIYLRDFESALKQSSNQVCLHSVRMITNQSNAVEV